MTGGQGAHYEPAVAADMFGYVQQPSIAISQPNPQSGLLYTVLNTTPFVRIIYVSASVTWTAQPTPLDAVITIDGITITHIQANPVSTQAYAAAHNLPYDDTAQSFVIMAANVSQYAFLYEGKSVKVAVRTTGGTVSNISARVKYAQKQVYV